MLNTLVHEKLVSMGSQSVLFVPTHEDARRTSRHKVSILEHPGSTVPMRLEWPVYVFTACVFLAFALGVHYLDLGKGAVVGLFVLLTLAYAWVAWIMIKQEAVLELHAYRPCSACSELTPTQGQHCMHCGVAQVNQ